MLFCTKSYKLFQRLNLLFIHYLGEFTKFVAMGLRQEKFGRQMQRDLGEILLAHKNDWLEGHFVTLSQVRVSADLGHIKAYVSMFNAKDRNHVMSLLELHLKDIRMELAKRVRNEIKKVPEVAFFEDDTLDYVNKMDKLFESLKNTPPENND